MNKMTFSRKSGGPHLVDIFFEPLFVLKRSEAPSNRWLHSSLIMKKFKESPQSSCYLTANYS